MTFKAKVVFSKFTLSEGLRPKINKAMYQAYGLHRADTIKRDITKAVKYQHHYAQRAVEQALVSGIKPLGSGAKQISYYGETGGKRIMTTPYWIKLSKKYAASEPPSRAFWMKHPGGGRYKHGKFSRTSLLSLYRDAMLVSERARSSKTRIVKETDRYQTLAWDINLKAPENILQRYITEPMLFGVQFGRVNDQLPSGMEVDRSGISFMKWLEERRAGATTRPFVRRLSSLLGVELRQRIRNLIKR